MMSEEIKQMMICTNGHQVQDSDAKFCMFCRAPLSVLQTPQQNPIQQETPQQNFPQQTIPQQNPFQEPSPVQSPFQQSTPIMPQMPAPQVQNQQYPTPAAAAVQPNYYPQQQYIQQQQHQMPHVSHCKTCGGNGKHLSQQIIICKECGWLRPLAEGYGVDITAFQWSEDGKAMNALKAITPLTMAAEAISSKVGRRWIESTFNSVILSENQLPDVYEQAVRAARILGMSYMPDVYVSGELMWDCKTFGSDKDSFIVMGSALATNFRGPELLFLFAREIGHCRTGHALWQTVIRFLMGEQGRRKGLMGGGLFAALSPTALMEGAIETPLLAWARQAEITADRAGMLAVGDEEIVRRVLLSWSLKSSFLYRQINVAAWLKQQASSGDDFSKLSELTTSSTPYITRRLKILADFAQSPELLKWQKIIGQYSADFKKLDEKKNAQMPPVNDGLKINCTACGTMLYVPHKVLEGKEQLNVRCSNAQCRKVVTLTNKAAKLSKQQAAQQPTPSKVEGKNEEKIAQPATADNDIRTKCTACGSAMRIPLKALDGKQQINVRCPNAKCGKVVTLKKKTNSASSEKEQSAKTQKKLERNQYDDNE